MITDEQRKQFEIVSRPIIEWINNNCNPHTSAIVSCDGAELLEGVCSIVIEDYIKD